MANLGGLGAKEGPAVSYNWTRPNPLPALLPWLALLVLLLLKPNRCARAWLIWLPLVWGLGVQWFFGATAGLLPQEVMNLFGQMIGALMIGLAAVWLLAPVLGRRHGFLGFLGTLLASAGFTALAFACTQDWEGAGGEAAVTGTTLVIAVVVIAVALSLAGWRCRKRYSRLRFSLWLVAALVAIWVVVAGVFFVLTRIGSPGQPRIYEVLVPVLIMTGLCLAALLPFLVLSFASTFYHDRLKNLLRLGGAVRPPLIAPPPPLPVEAARSSP